MIRLTLPDGTRIQIAATEITDVESAGDGAVVHLTSGETMRVLQDAQILEARLRIAWARGQGL